MTVLTHHGLNDVARHLDIPIPADRHRAMADVELTLTVLTRLLGLGPWCGLHGLERDARLEPKDPTTDTTEQEACSNRPTTRQPPRGCGARRF
ncbi:hypothetical protein [Amycolatopsis albispora]|uniref:hypothetical protein n=1 Tax=Amycolatopsis albispora TaxID=1804986 RepID=UPI0013B40025|nr:hypothetical protein [Amycolatopsis albispora]